MKFRKKNYFITIFIALLAMNILIPGFVMAGEKMYYRSYDSSQKKVLNTFSIETNQLSNGNYKVYWQQQEKDLITDEEYLLDERFETISWQVKTSDKKTNYEGSKKEDKLFISGLFNGEKVEKVIDVKNRPFYYNPKLGLMAFVKSKEQKIRFWGFNNRELLVYPLRAVKKTEEIINVAGKDIETIKVDWTVDDFRSAFFSRSYWFRKSDGYYIKQKVDKEIYREFIK